MAINSLRKQDLLLHLVSWNDMPTAKWKKFFKNDAEVKFLKNNNHDQWGLIRHDKPIVIQMLQSILDKVEDVALEAPVVQPKPLIVEKQGIVSKRSVVAPTHVTSTSMTSLISTDKGDMFNVANMKTELSNLYHMENFDKVFTDALSAAKIDIKWSYISSVKKRSLMSQIKKAVKASVDKTLNNI